MTVLTCVGFQSRGGWPDHRYVSTNLYLPAAGWLPDPSHAGMLRLRMNGEWTNDVVTRQVPWGPQRMLPPTLHMPVSAVACV